MKKISLKIIFSVIVLSSLSFTLTNDWYIYDSSNFKISFPQKPTEETKVMKTENGEIEVKTLTYKAQNSTEKNLRFFFSYNDIPNSKSNLTKDDEKIFLDAAIKGSVRNHKAILISEKSINFNAYTGREVKMSMSDDKIIVNMKTYVIGNKYYGLIIYTPKQNDGNSEIDSFFNSFAIK